MPFTGRDSGYMEKRLFVLGTYFFIFLPELIASQLIAWSYIQASQHLPTNSHQFCCELRMNMIAAFYDAFGPSDFNNMYSMCIYIILHNFITNNNTHVNTLPKKNRQNQAANHPSLPCLNFHSFLLLSQGSPMAWAVFPESRTCPRRGNFGDPHRRQRSARHRGRTFLTNCWNNARSSRWLLGKWTFVTIVYNCVHWNRSFASFYFGKWRIVSIVVHFKNLTLKHDGWMLLGELQEPPAILRCQHHHGRNRKKLGAPGCEHGSTMESPVCWGIIGPTLGSRVTTDGGDWHTKLRLRDFKICAFSLLTQRRCGHSKHQ